MSGPYDHGMNMPASNIIDPTYPVYNGNFNAVYPRLAGPATHFDGVAFWYNPTNSDQLYDRDQNIYAGRGGAQQASSMESSASVKHRRTRSGCFTCRSRRVKVMNMSLYFTLCANVVGSAMKPGQSVTVRFCHYSTQTRPDIFTLFRM